MQARRRGDGALGRIDHFVFLMFENRSFDNVAGWLYAPGNPPPFDRPPRGQAFDGLAGRRLGNPLPPVRPGAPAGWAPAGRTADGTSPGHDPGEGYAHVNAQLFGTFRPADPGCGPPRPPYNLPSPVPRVAPMDGFARDYAATLRCRGLPADPAAAARVLDGLVPEAVPVLSSLAHAYALCDRWFCAVPSGTWANRSFALAASSSGFVDDGPLLQWLRNDAPTVFNRMEAAGPGELTWRVYFDLAQILPLTWLICGALRGHLFTNFAPMARFYRDAAAGTLPSVAWIEPLMTGANRNDEHPPSEVWRGEQLLLSVYRALRRGPAWPRTLLVVTYDEHGGLYDHVPPPAAVPPLPGAPPGQFGFRFDRLGPRVCTLFISPWVAPGTVFRARDDRGRELPLDHSAIVRTLCQRFGLAPLTRRDAASPGFGGVLTLERPRQDDPPVPVPSLRRPPRRPQGAAPPGATGIPPAGAPRPRSW